MSAERPDPDWRDDPRWRLVDYDDEYFGDGRPVPQRPPHEAELAQPDNWASLYAGRKVVATWSRG